MKRTMTFTLSLFLLSLFPLTVFAEEGEEILKRVREKFETGSSPTEEYLTNTKFKCKEIIAWKGLFEAYRIRTLSFKKNDNKFIKKQAYTRMNDVAFKYNGYGVVGSLKVTSGKFEGSTFYQSFRVAKDGALIGEFTQVAEKLHERAHLDPISRFDGKVVSYTFCRPHTKINSILIKTKDIFSGN